MIIAVIGNVGSGKSVSVVKQIVRNQRFCFTNFDINTKNSQRIKKEDVIKEEVISYKKDGSPKTKEYKVNWDFWNEALRKEGDYHIFLDEVHNLISSRQSMSKFNVLMTQWISQIRKILGRKEKTHIYLISQRINRIDVAFRDLLHLIIYCERVKKQQTVNTKIVEDGKEKIIKAPITWIFQYFFRGENCVDKYLAFREGRKTYDLRTGFIANPYFKFYDSYEIIGETAYL